ncbi:hypothetical protein [Amycolatopsis sp. cmx-11-12]|uniref:hypothetical protein n=1 Tax=Amycolatopsis sp. cmx-11-12 TaxID=2785795 RepID=UPI003917B945
MKHERVIDIELYRTVFNDPGETYVSWGAEWGLRDDSVGTEDSSEDVAAVLEDLRLLADCYTVRLEWQLGGDPPEGKTVADAVAEWA